MSNAINETLLFEAEEWINSGELSSTPMEAMLEEDIKHGDLQALWQHIMEVRDFLREE